MRVNKNIPWEEVLKSLPDRNLNAATQHLGRLKKAGRLPPRATPLQRGAWPAKTSGARWTSDEDELLIECQDRNYSWIDTAALLPGRTPPGCLQRWTATVSAIARDRKEAAERELLELIQDPDDEPSILDQYRKDDDSEDEPDEPGGFGGPGGPSMAPIPPIQVS